MIVLREILWKIIENKWIRIAYIRAIQNMYEGVSTSVRHIGLHQGSTLSTYLLTLILDVLTKDIQEIAPRCVFFAYDIVLVGKLKEDLNERLETSFRNTSFFHKQK